MYEQLNSISTNENFLFIFARITKRKKRKNYSKVCVTEAVGIASYNLIISKNAYSFLQRDQTITSHRTIVKSDVSIIRSVRCDLSGPVSVLDGSIIQLVAGYQY